MKTKRMEGGWEGSTEKPWSGKAASARAGLQAALPPSGKAEVSHKVGNALNSETVSKVGEGY